MADVHTCCWSKVEELRAENARLRAKLERLEKKRRTFDNSRSLFVQPPVEILREIMELATAPPALLDPSLALGPNSPWSQALRMKKSMALVCKMWHSVGVNVLYNSVVLRRIGQIASLWHTLQKNSNLGLAIRSLRVSCIMIPGYLSVFQDGLRGIMASSPSARVYLDMSVHGQVSLLQAIPPDFDASSVSHLEMRYYISFSYVSHHLSCFTNLVSLVIWPCSYEAAQPTDQEMFEPNITLTRLTELHLGLDLALPSHHLIMDTIASKWRLPSLKRLSLALNLTQKVELLNRLFRAHGHYLSYLCIYLAGMYIDHEYPSDVGAAPVDLQDCLDCCPALRHLVTDLYYWLAPEPYSHPKIEWICIWTWGKAVARGARSTRRYNPSHRNFPALKGRRDIDIALRPVLGYLLPVHFPPELEARQWQFPGIHVKQRSSESLGAAVLWKADLHYVKRHAFASMLKYNTEEEFEECVTLSSGSSSVGYYLAQKTTTSASSDGDYSDVDSEGEATSSEIWEANLGSALDTFQETLEDSD
ncbi:hypothetical protein BV22DRAFT_467230 [Leucogyrophana mollusca]|uniref:Uncharacterized protein n=1 Tax=Leucogyrophana mollusca TaxID=85980 RepID=A0ACB8BI78_9AGAM|nr:hypothetical protein BV22DRAFT_467230 [Leucogyrophana mollusca]